jgi:Flp pilus assembly protein TadD
VKIEKELRNGRDNFSNSDPSGLQLFGKGLTSLIDGIDVQNRRLRLVLGALIIFTLIFLVYRPILPGSFVVDDARLIGSDNPLVNGQFTPLSIWFQTDFTLTTLVWRGEGFVFGDNPAGYHAVNMALQAISALLIWCLLARLKIPGAWLAAALFAVHPVCVNSVARVAELKNTLSLPFYLLSFLGYLQYESLALYPANGRAGDNRRATLWLTVSMIAFVLSLLSKTTAVMLPAVLLLCAAWQRRRLTRRDWLHTSPYFVLALAFGLMTIWFQKHQALPLTGTPLQPAGLGERLAGSGYDFWFYLGKALLPVNLSMVYYRWRIDANTLTAYLPDLLVCAVFVLCWRFRRSWGRHVLFGLGCFAVTLFPALGFFDSQFLTMWQVSDHLQYLPLIAAMALVAAGLAVLPDKATFRSAAGALLLIFSVLSFERVKVFTTEESLLRDTLKKSPAAWAARNDLGVILVKKGDYPAALDQFALSLQFNSDSPDTHANLGYVLALQGKFAEADAQYLAALKIKPDASQTHKMYAEALELQGKNLEALHHFQMAVRLKPDAEAYMQLASLFYATGDLRQAVAQFHHALQFKPDQVEALNNLAWILATCPDGAVRDGDEAVRCAERACQLTAFKRAGMVGTLAAAYAEAGRFPEAVSTAEKAVRLATATGDTQFAAVNQRLLMLYRAGKPWHGELAGNGR